MATLDVDWFSFLIYTIINALAAVQIAGDGVGLSLFVQRLAKIQAHLDKARVTTHIRWCHLHRLESHQLRLWLDKISMRSLVILSEESEQFLGLVHLLQLPNATVGSWQYSWPAPAGP